VALQPNSFNHEGHDEKHEGKIFHRRGAEDAEKDMPQRHQE